MCAGFVCWNPELLLYCIDWSVVRIGRRESISVYIMLRRVGVNLHGLECTCHNWGTVRILINGLLLLLLLLLLLKSVGNARMGESD